MLRQDVAWFDQYKLGVMSDKIQLHSANIRAGLGPEMGRVIESTAQGLSHSAAPTYLHFKLSCLMFM